jgi:hypothetical protein
MNPAIVVVFSLSGHTRRVGAQIAQSLGCPMVEISEPRPRRGALGYLRSGFEALFRILPAIEPIDRDLRDFSVVVVGTPVWVGHLSSPVRSFLARHRSEIRSLAAFCAMGGRDPVNAFADIASVCGKTPLATLAVSERDLDTPQYAARLGTFLAALRQAG